MTKSIFVITTVVMLLFVISDSSAQRDHSKVEYESVPTAPTVFYPSTTEEIYDFVELHPGASVKQLTKTTVDGRLQYVLGVRIAGIKVSF